MKINIENTGEEYGNRNGELNTKTTTGEVYTARVNSELQGIARKNKTWNSNLIFENLTWLTSREAAEYLRLPSVGALRVLVCKRQIPFHKLGRNLRFKKTELDRLLETSRNGGI